MESSNVQDPSVEFAKLLFPNNEIDGVPHDTSSLHENNPSFETNSALASGRLGAQFSMNGMRKTQDTNWMRPNAELAANIPESSYNMEGDYNAGKTFNVNSFVHDSVS